MQLPTEHTVRGDLPHPCSEESDVRLIILAVVESRATRTLVPAQPVDATPSDKSFLFIGGVYDRRKTG
jgi:hypothetical protein